MNELLAKIKAHAQKIESLKAQAESLIVKAEAEGTVADDRAKFLAEADKIQAELTPLLAEAQALQTRVNLLTAAGAFVGAPLVPPVNPGVANTGHQSPNAGRQTVPAQARRYGPLRAFHGADGEARAYQSGLFVAGAILGHAASRQRYEERYGPLATTLSTTSNTGAAYFIPDVMDMAIVKLTEEYGVARRYCRIQPMTADTWEGPRWTGTLTAYFVAEGTAPTQSEQTYDKIGLVAKNVAAFGKMSRNLQEDAIIDLGDEWAEAAAVAFAQKEDNALFNGDGTSTYGGITGVLTKIVAAANSAGLSIATGHTTLAALTLADYSAAAGLIANYPGIKPVWYCHKEAYYNSMQPLQMAAGGATPMDVANGGKPMMLGYPVEFVNVMPRASALTTGVTGILFADLRMAAAFGDRRQRTFETGLQNDDFSKQLLSLLMTERFDINAHTIVDPKNSSNPGPVVGLKIA